MKWLIRCAPAPILVLTLGMSACSSGEAAVEASRLQTTEVDRGDLSIRAEAIGTVEPVRVVEVKSKASGEILTLQVDIGDEGAPGQILAEVDPRDVRNNFDQAVAIDEVLCGRRVALADGVELRVVAAVIALGEHREIDQGIGHAAHGGDHHPDTGVRHLEDNARHPTKTLAIGKTAAAELMNFPALFRHLSYPALSENRA